MYPGMAKTARDEGFDEVADWFETLAKAERSHANRFTKALDAHTSGTIRRSPCNNTCAQCVVIFMTKPWTACLKTWTKYHICPECGCGKEEYQLVA
jgi:rubrerythrin